MLQGSLFLWTRCALLSFRVRLFGDIYTIPPGLPLASISVDNPSFFSGSVGFVH